MKRILFLCLIGLLLVGYAWGQAVPNPSFELWEADTAQFLARWYNSNRWSYPLFLAANVTQRTDEHGGNYAVRLETFANPSDTAVGYIANSAGDFSLGQGGQPYTGQPDTLRGWAKYDIQPGDTAIAMVSFKASGIVIATDFFIFTGSASSYTLFEMPLSLSSAPDSVMIAFASSLPGRPSAKAGSWLILDDLSFNVPQGVTAGNFELWLPNDREEPSGWTSPDIYGDTAEVVRRTTDAVTGQYAIKIMTKVLFEGSDTIGFATTGLFRDSSQTGGQPYQMTTDTLCGYYKYQGIGVDSAIIAAHFFHADTLVGLAAAFLDTKNQFTYFEIPFQLGQMPDTVRIDLWSSNPNGHPEPGSVLIVDSLRFKSDPLVGLPRPRAASAWRISPNPSHGLAWIDIQVPQAGTYALEVWSSQGQRVLSQSISLNAGMQRIPLDGSAWPSGVYMVWLSGESDFPAMRLVVE